MGPFVKRPLTLTSLLGHGASIAIRLEAWPVIFLMTTEAYRQMISSHENLREELTKLDLLSEIWLEQMLGDAETEKIKGLEEKITVQSKLVKELILTYPIPQTIADNISLQYQKSQ